MNSINMPIVNVLIVDDIEHNLTALAALLARPEVRLLVARSGVEALELLLEHDVAVAILDVNMPGMSGFELASLIRGSPRTSHVPIIFLTATSQDAIRTFQGYEAGAVDFLYKPIEPRIVQSKVGIFVQLELQKRQLAEQLAATRQMLEANEMLMAVLSHDLRTPLSAVMSSAEYLMRASTDEKTTAVGRRIEHCGRRMTRMVEQLLNLARLQGGRLPLRRSHVQLDTLCQAVIEEFAANTATLADSRLVFEAHGDLAGQWDSDLVAQAVANLVNNALTHGEAHAPVRVRANGESPGEVLVTVANLGAIPADVMPLLFGAFSTATRAERQGSGLGLGLHIVRLIARTHGGDVNVISNEAEGTVFTIRLPRRPQPGAQPGDVALF
ncbi:response regulator [Paraburkholderia sp. Ac-20340]|uniref:hybrid sensor histidine kinase/response regulator n=1 Tax=Paraburkholderia sp. Ac-20340 TaxID=2703888 RepID=UPI00197E0628|nr:hybrid sensor histidine kinase/response regulator [Paraburkholderia sp. Ac-20340]MBN3852107.1 response regulator [Paraburkholderia sp. Ac-20340]